MSEQLQKKYAEFQALQAQLEEVGRYLEAVEQKKLEARLTKKYVEEIKDAKEGSEMLVPLANGIFIHANLQNPGAFVMNVGSDVCADKSGVQVQELVDSQIVEIEKVEEELKQNVEAIGARLNAVVEEINSLSENV